MSFLVIFCLLSNISKGQVCLVEIPCLLAKLIPGIWVVLNTELLRFIFPYVLVHPRCYNKTLVGAGAYKEQKIYF